MTILTILLLVMILGAAFLFFAKVSFDFLTNPINKIVSMLCMVCAITVLIIIPLFITQNTKSETKEIASTPIEIKSIESYEQDLLQEYQIHTVKGESYDTGNNLQNSKHVFITKSDDNDFHLSEITTEIYQKCGPLKFDKFEITEVKFEIPSKYFKYHTIKNEDKLTHIYP